MTKEEIALAKELDLLTYFKLVEPGNLKLVGKEYRHKVHSSLTISKDSLWCWHCIGLHGRTALKYLIDVEKVPYVEAVREINRIQGGVVHSSQPVSLPQPRAEPEAPRDFKLPNRDGQQLFQVRNGQRIIENYADGSRLVKDVQTVDDTHFYVGSRFCHIQQYANQCFKRGCYVEPEHPQPGDKLAASQNIAAGHAQILANYRNQNIRAILPEGIF